MDTLIGISVNDNDNDVDISSYNLPEQCLEDVVLPNLDIVDTLDTVNTVLQLPEQLLEQQLPEQLTVKVILDEAVSATPPEPTVVKLFTNTENW